MGAYAGPDGVESGLVLSLDAGNIKGFDSNENLLTNTTSVAAWTSGTFTTETTYPILGLNTVRITDLSSDGDAAYLNGVAISPGTYTVSHYIDTINSTSTSVLLYIFTFHALNGGFTFSNANALFTLSTKTFSSISYSGPAWSNASVSAVNIGNGIYRISITATTSLSSADPGIRAYLTPYPLDTSYLLVAGSQYETGSVANKYYPTSGTAKTRGTTWTDLSGRGVIGTLSGAGYSGTYGGSLVFDGTDDYVDTNNTFNFNQTDQFSVELWINFISHSDREAAAAGIVGKGHYYDNGWDIFLFNTHQIAFETTGNPTRQGSTYLLTPVLSLSTWHYYIATYNNGTKIIYLNGSQNSNQSYVGPGNFNNSNNVLIGRRFGDSSRSLRGNLSFVKIYNRALTATEIQQNFNATKSRYGL